MDSSEPKPDADKCPECGGWLNELSPGEAVCSACGVRFENGEGKRSGGNAKGVMVRLCPQCGNQDDADPDSLYCDQCGAALSGVAPVPETAAQADAGAGDGACPSCGGTVVEYAPNRAVCRGCGERLVTPEARDRARWGFLFVIALAAVYILAMLFGSARGRP